MEESLVLDGFFESRPPLIDLLGLQRTHASLLPQLATAHLKLLADQPHTDAFRSHQAPHTLPSLLRQPDDDEQSLRLVLKHGWMLKHARLCAAISVLFVRIDTPHADIARELRSVRERRPSKRARVVVVLVQSRTDAGGAAGGEENIAAIRRATELEPRQLLAALVTGAGAELELEPASAQRLARELVELAAGYYRDEARRGKTPKKRSARLIARYHFKRAFFSELAKDAAAALKHWGLCYAQLRELVHAAASTRAAGAASNSPAIVESSVAPPPSREVCAVPLHELKRVAGFVNRKVCRVSLALPGRLAETIEAFRHHVLLFRLRLLPASAFCSATEEAAAAHLHAGWLCKQYRLFATMLEESKVQAPGGSVLATNAEPGYYYQAAANLALERRACAERLSAVGSAAAAAVRVEGRPAAELAKELGLPDSVSAELDSRAVIELLTRSYERFKRSRSSRMIYFLAAQMADEYLHTRNFEMAHRFYEKIWRSYERERWWRALAHIQTSLRACAIARKALPDFVHSSVALLSRELSTRDQAECVLGELLALVRLAEPPAAYAFSPLRSPLSVEVRPAQQLFRCCGRWEPAQVPLGESSTLSLRIFSSAVVNLSVHAIELVGDGDISRLVHHAGTQEELPAGQEPRRGELTLLAGGELEVSLKHAPATEGLVLLQHLRLHVGEAPCAIILGVPLLRADDEGDTWTQMALPSVVEPPRLRVSPPPLALQLNLEAAAPLFLGEMAPLGICVETGSEPVSGATLSARVAPATALQPTPGATLGASPAPELTPSSSAAPSPPPPPPPPPRPPSITSPAASTPSDAGATSAADSSQGGLVHALVDELGAPLSEELPLETLPAGTERRVLLQMRALAKGRLHLSASVSYPTPKGLQQIKLSHHLDIVEALEMRCTLHRLGERGRSSGALYRGETSRLVVTARCVAPSPTVLHIRGVALEKDNGSERQLEVVSTTWREGQQPEELLEGEEWTAILVVRAIADGQPDGRVRVCWSRAEALAATPLGETHCALPRLEVESPELAFDFSTPIEGRLGVQLLFSLRVTNKTAAPHPIRVACNENESFLFSGYKLHNVLLPPGASHVSTFSLLPIRVGAVSLPPVRLQSVASGKEHLDPSCKRLVFIAPGSQCDRRLSPSQSA